MIIALGVATATQSVSLDGQAPYTRCLERTEIETAGWGTWIRTKDARVRAGSFTAKLSPNGIARMRAASGAGGASSTPHLRGQERTHIFVQFSLASHPREGRDYGSVTRRP